MPGHVKRMGKKGYLEQWKKEKHEKNNREHDGNMWKEDTTGNK